MSPERQRIKIAEAVGWTPTPTGWWTMHPSGIPTGEYPAFTDPPDYLNDLNAMHEAVSCLTPKQVDAFAIELSAIVLENPSKAWWDLNANEVGHVANATAAQRAEAFLRTLNLWEES